MKLEDVTRIINRCIGEFSSSAMLMFIGCMGCINVESFPRLNLLEIGVNFGMVITFCVMTHGIISGSHMTPTLSIAACLLDKLEWYWMLIYVAFQCLGSLFGYTMLMLTVPAAASQRLCLTLVNSHTSLGQAVALEFLVTAVLVLFTCAAWDESNKNYHDSLPIRIGLMVASMVLSEGHYTGASMNMARTLAPAIYQNVYTNIWIYPVGQLPAATLIPLLWKYFLSPSAGAENSANSEKQVV